MLRQGQVLFISSCTWVCCWKSLYAIQMFAHGFNKILKTGFALVFVACFKSTGFSEDLFRKSWIVKIFVLFWFLCFKHL